MKKHFFALTLLVSIVGASQDLRQCLRDADRATHILDQERLTEGCFRIHKSELTNLQCFNLVERLKAARKKMNMSETLNSICFYETTEFKSIKSCTTKADLFKIASNHDEALFECYRQFQETLTAKDCSEISREMIYPKKKEHLQNQCANGI